MEIRQLKYFLVVAQQESMTAAAQRLFISQSSLSRTIALLESDLGVTLFARTGNKIKLNNAGVIFRRRVENALNELEDGILEITGQDSGVINIGNTFPEPFTAFFVQYAKRYPKVRITQQHIGRDQVTELLSQRKLDLVISSEKIKTPDIDWQSLITEELLFLVSADNPLAKKGQARLSELRDENFFLYGRDLYARINLEQRCLEAGFSPRITYEGNAESLVYNLVAEGFAATLASPSLYRFKKGDNPDLFGRIGAVKITDYPLTEEFGIATLKSRYIQPSAERFIAELSQALGADKG